MKLGVHNWYFILMFVESCTINYDTMVTVLSLIGWMFFLRAGKYTVLILNYSANTPLLLLSATLKAGLLLNLLHKELFFFCACFATFI